MNSLDCLAFGAHPDDVELGCGGTLALLARAGRRVGIVHLTRGEAGTRGTPDLRRQEAEAAAGILGAEAVEFLDLGDGRLSRDLEAEDRLIALLRRYRPELVLLPPLEDRHPDHGRAHRLLRDACFYAGLVRRGAGRPHRPAAGFWYMGHDGFEPAFIVDISSTWEAKQAALDAYRSQLHSGRSEETEAGPVTKIGSRAFRQAIEGRARVLGARIGAEFGEGFGAPGPLSVHDPWLLLPKGVR